MAIHAVGVRAAGDCIEGEIRHSSAKPCRRGTRMTGPPPHSFTQFCRMNSELDRGARRARRASSAGHPCTPLSFVGVAPATTHSCRDAGQSSQQQQNIVDVDRAGVAMGECGTAVTNVAQDRPDKRVAPLLILVARPPHLITRASAAMLAESRPPGDGCAVPRACMLHAGSRSVGCRGHCSCTADKRLGGIRERMHAAVTKEAPLAPAAPPVACHWQPGRRAGGTSTCATALFVNSN